MLTYEIRWLLARCAKKIHNACQQQGKVCRLNSSKYTQGNISSYFFVVVFFFYLKSMVFLFFFLALHTRCTKPIWIRENIFIFLFILWYIVFSVAVLLCDVYGKIMLIYLFLKNENILYDHSCVRHSRIE